MGLCVNRAGGGIQVVVPLLLVIEARVELNELLNT